MRAKELIEELQRLEGNPEVGIEGGKLIVNPMDIDFQSEHYGAWMMAREQIMTERIPTQIRDDYSDEKLIRLCAYEFEELRRSGPKYSRSQKQRMDHLEEHLDRGDPVCKCQTEGERPDE